MRSSNYLLIIFLATCLSYACSSEDKTDVDLSRDCTFVQNDDDMDGIIDPSERAIMNDCLNAALNSTEEIKANLVGEWKLIGHGEGWIPTISQPCGYIEISEDMLQLEYESGWTDTTITLSWEIEQVIHSNGFFFRLNTSPSSFHALNMTLFCEEYMFGDDTPADGNMYLYQKVN